jgi:DNA polymerase-4
VPRDPPLVVEVWGWDEAFIGVVTAEPEAVAVELIDAVLAATELRCAIGIGENRLQAKTATGFAKAMDRGAPRVARLTRADWIPTMGAEPVTAIWGIGDRTAARLAQAGIATVEQLARADHVDLARRFGPTIGPSLRILGLGGDNAPLVAEPWVAKSRGKEVTYTRDLVEADEIASQVDSLAREVTAEVVAQDRLVTHVSVKVRTRTFFTATKIAKLPAPTTDADVVAAKAADVLARFDVRQPVRLLGVRVLLAPPGEAAAAGHSRK